MVQITMFCLETSCRVCSCGFNPSMNCRLRFNAALVWMFPNTGTPLSIKVSFECPFKAVKKAGFSMFGHPQSLYLAGRALCTMRLEAWGLLASLWPN